MPYSRHQRTSVKEAAVKPNRGEDDGPMDRLGHQIDALRRDLAHAGRVARRRPAFSAAVVLTLGLGVGANAGVFGLIDAVLFSPLPYERPDGLYGVFERNASGQLRVPSYPTYLDLTDQTEAFEALAFARGVPITYQTADYSGLLLGAFVTEGFFDMLGVPAVLGRSLDADDYATDADGATLLSERAWRRYFGSDPDIIGETLAVAERTFTIVGVLPASFAYPDWGADNDLWMPLTHLPAAELAALDQRAFGADSRLLGRIGDDVDPAEAAAAMARFTEALATAHPETNAGWSVALESLKEREVRGVRARLLMLWGAALLLLVMCCLNVSNLYLVQGSARRKEHALRTALGANRSRVFAQIATETLLLALVGGVIGIVIAQRGLAWASEGLAELPRISEVGLDARVLVFAGFLSITSALLFALLSARHVGGASLSNMIRGSEIGTKSSTSLLSGIQAAQVSMTFVLLLGAWLLGETFMRLVRLDPGYQPMGLIGAQINPPSPDYDDEDAAARLYTDLIQGVEAVPGVTSVALTNHGPGGTAGLPTAAAVERPPQNPEQDLSVYYRTISDGYFSTIGTPVIAGREFTRDDLTGPEGPIIVNEALAEYFGGAASAIGRTLGVRKAASSRADFGEPLMGTVIGVVADLATAETGGREQLVAFVPFTHSPWAQARLLARMTDTSASSLRAVEDAIRALEPGIPLSGPFVGVERLEDQRIAQRSRERLNAGVTAAFATLALLLASIGMYGVTSFVVTLRTREMGVRLALGASPGRVASAVVSRAAIVGTTGLVFGAVVAALASRSMAPLLFGVNPLHSGRYLAIAAMLTALTAGAAYLPARRASRLDPATVLRAD